MNQAQSQQTTKNFGSDLYPNQNPNPNDEFVQPNTNLQPLISQTTIQIAPQYAGFWIRLAALMIDNIVLNIFLGPIVIAMMGLMIRNQLLANCVISSGSSPCDSSGMAAVFYLIFFLLGIIAFLYRILMTSKYGATIGKMVVGVRIVGHDYKKITFGRAFLREFLGKIVSGMVMDLGYLWVAFHPQKQGWHDMIADTYVVYPKTLPTQSQQANHKKTNWVLIIFIIVIVVIISSVVTWFSARSLIKTIRDKGVTVTGTSSLGTTSPTSSAKTTTPSTSSTNNTSSATISGKIISINNAAASMVIQNGQTTNNIYNIYSSQLLFSSNKQANESDLKVGQTVTVTFNTTDNSATKIVINE